MKHSAENGLVRHVTSLLLVAAISGCAANAKQEAFDPKLAGQVTASAAEAAVGKPGAKVCRWVPLGISERDLIRGVVQQQEPAQSVRVRIEDPGRFTNSLNGTPLVRGALVLDKAVAWTPCVF